MQTTARDLILPYLCNQGMALTPRSCRCCADFSDVRCKDEDQEEGFDQDRAFGVDTTAGGCRWRERLLLGQSVGCGVLRLLGGANIQVRGTPASR